jgi:hypothetical protein
MPRFEKIHLNSGDMNHSENAKDARIIWHQPDMINLEAAPETSDFMHARRLIVSLTGSPSKSISFTRNLRKKMKSASSPG